MDNPGPSRFDASGGALDMVVNLQKSLNEIVTALEDEGIIRLLAMLQYSPMVGQNILENIRSQLEAQQESMAHLYKLLDCHLSKQASSQSAGGGFVSSSVRSLAEARGVSLEQASAIALGSMFDHLELSLAQFGQGPERQGFGRQSNRGNGNNNQQKANGSSNSSPTSVAPSIQSLGNSPSYSSTMGSDSGSQNNDVPEPPKFFFREKFARLGVKGNFMPLAAQPKNVDLGEWLAHQAAEQYRVVTQVIQCIQDVDEKAGMPICNPKMCPTMSAGRHTYTWLNSHKEPIKVPAAQYIELVQRWIGGKLNDPKAFPTDTISSTASTYASGGLNTPSANTPIAMGPTTSDASLSTLAGHDWVGKGVGFPENFYHDVKNIMRQIFRIYAHVYHAHWVDPFWHITSGSNSNGWTDLNSCFVHYISVAKLFGLLSEKDMEPMQPLIDIWIANGSIPPDAAAGACAIVPSQ